MSLKEKIDCDVKLAMKEKNPDKLAALRAVKSAIMLEVTKSPDVLITDAICLKLIAKLLKQRKDAAAIFMEQNREDLAEDEIRQSNYLQEYLPEQMSESEIRKIVKEVIIQVGAVSSADMGTCMGVLIQRLGGKADGKLISKLVKDELF